jgi:hypothetical protein
MGFSGSESGGSVSALSGRWGIELAAVDHSINIEKPDKIADQVGSSARRFTKVVGAA